MGNLIRQLIPFIAVDLVILVLLTVFPGLSLFLPRLFGFVS